MSYMNDDCDPFGMPYPKEEPTSRELPRQRPLSKDGEKYVLYKDYGEIHILKDGEVKWSKVYPISRNQLLEIVNEFNELNNAKKDLEKENKQLKEEIKEL